MTARHSILLKSIYIVAESLGADLSTRRKLSKKLESAPNFIAEYHCNFIWPKRRVYDGPELMDGIDLSSVSLGGPVEPMPDHYDVPGAEDMEVYAIGTEGGGNYILHLDGNDSKPQNPTVYSLDHEMQSEPAPICDLLRFLKGLESPK